MILTAALAAAAVAVLLSRPPSRHRLETLVPRPQAVGPSRSAGTRAVLCALLGVLAWWLVGGLAGLVLGIALGAGGPPLLGHLDARNDPEEELTALQLPLALDLVGACLSGGAPLAQALASVAGAVGGPVGARLLRVSTALSVGALAEEAFAELGDAGAAGAAARALCRAAEGGTPVAAAVTRVAEESRRRAATVARTRVRQAGVKAAAPLTLCFLPAFLLLGTVPCVIAVTGPLLGAL